MEGHAAKIIPWFKNKDDSLLWGGRVFGWPLCETEIINRSCADNIQFFVLVDSDSQVQGFIELQQMSLTEMRLCRVAVNPIKRGAGVGKHLIQASLSKIAHFPQIEVVTLAVYKSNVVAKKCYDSIGFQVTDKQPMFKVFDGEVWPLYQMEIVL